MKDFIVTWRTSLPLAVVSLVIGVFMNSAGTGESVWNSVLTVPVLPLGLLEAFVTPVLFWTSPRDVIVASFFTLFAMLMTVAGVADLLRKRNPIA
jgi:hypothetical protein